MADLDEPNGNPTMDGICFNLHFLKGISHVPSIVISDQRPIHSRLIGAFNPCSPQVLGLPSSTSKARASPPRLWSSWVYWSTDGFNLKSLMAWNLRGPAWPTMAYHGPPSTTLQTWGPLQRSLMVIDFGKGFDPEQKHCTGCSSKC